MIGKKRRYFKLVCTEVDALEFCVHIDVNKGDLDEVEETLEENIEKYPNAKWELYPMYLM